MKYASITKRGAKHTVRWRDLSGRAKRRACPTYAAAKALKLEVESALALGRDWAPQHRKVTLDRIVTDWVTDLVRTHAPGTLSQRLMSIDALNQMLAAKGVRDPGPELLSRALLSEYYAFYLARRQPIAYKLTQAQIDEIRLRRANGERVPDLADEHGVSEATVYRYLTTDLPESTRTPASPTTAAASVRHLQLLWQWAYDSEEYGDMVPRPRKLPLPKPTIRLTPVEHSWAICDQAVVAARRCGWGRLYEVLRYTGLRIGQVTRLQWDDVDLSSLQLTIRGALGKSAQESAGRIVPISPHLAELMKGWGERVGTLPLCPIATSGSRIGQPMKYGSNVARMVWGATGLDKRFWQQPAHTFRKAFISEMVSRSVPLHIIQTLVGHSGSVTISVYTDRQALMVGMREAVEAMPRIGTAGTVIALEQRPVRAGGKAEQ